MLFCVKFGRQDQDETSRKRKLTANIQFFKAPWRSDNIESHMKKQHQENYQEYKEEENKKAFFASSVTTFQPLNAANESLKMLVNKTIVEDIIGDLLLDPDSDDQNLSSRERALEIFQLQVEDGEGADMNPERYLISVRNNLQFTLVVKYIGAGLSFRQCSRVITDTKEATSLAQIGNINISKVITSTRYICAMAYQMISDTLGSLWAFSIALDGGTKSNVSYLDVRIRFSVQETIHNLHLVAIPMRESHTGDYMFRLVADFLNALCPSWKAKLIGVSSDGASNMTGHISGVVSRLHKVCLPGCYRVWCAAHQMDLAVQKVFKKLCNDSFINTLLGITGRLRRQQNLILEMKAKCPRFIDTRWLSMEKFLVWFVKKRPRLIEYFDEKKPSCMPNPAFWIMVHVMRGFVERVNFCLVKIQGLSTLLNEQQARMKVLVNELIEDGNVEGPCDFIGEDILFCFLLVRNCYQEVRQCYFLTAKRYLFEDSWNWLHMTHICLGLLLLSFSNSSSFRAVLATSLYFQWFGVLY